jgi:hypothetical protein
MYFHELDDDRASTVEEIRITLQMPGLSWLRGLTFWMLARATRSQPCLW